MHCEDCEEMCWDPGMLYIETPVPKSYRKFIRDRNYLTDNNIFWLRFLHADLQHTSSETYDPSWKDECYDIDYFMEDRIPQLECSLSTVISRSTSKHPNTSSLCISKSKSKRKVILSKCKEKLPCSKRSKEIIHFEKNRKYLTIESSSPSTNEKNECHRSNNCLITSQKRTPLPCYGTSKTSKMLCQEKCPPKLPRVKKPSCSVKKRCIVKKPSCISIEKKSTLLDCEIKIDQSLRNGSSRKEVVCVEHMPRRHKKKKRTTPCFVPRRKYRNRKPKVTIIRSSSIHTHPSATTNHSRHSHSHSHHPHHQHQHHRHHMHHSHHSHLSRKSHHHSHHSHHSNKHRPSCPPPSCPPKSGSLCTMSEEHELCIKVYKNRYYHDGPERVAFPTRHLEWDEVLTRISAHLGNPFDDPTVFLVKKNGESVNRMEDLEMGRAYIAVSGRDYKYNGCFFRIH